MYDISFFWKHESTTVFSPIRVKLKAINLLRQNIDEYFSPKIMALISKENDVTRRRGCIQAKVSFNRMSGAVVECHPSHLRVTKGLCNSYS